MLGFVLRVLAAGAVLLVIQGLAAGLTNALLGPSGVALPPGSLGWVVLSNLVTAAPLQGAVTAVPFSFVLVALMGRMRTKPPGPASIALPHGAGSWAWRLAVADLLYLACYLGAGNVIYPWVREFYESRSLPAQVLIAAMQLFFRGPIFIALTLLVVRMVDGDRWERAVVAGTTLSLLGGVGPLLIPNPYLPDLVRWAHFLEVGISNFIYGAAITWLMTPPPRPVAALAGSSA